MPARPLRSAAMTHRKPAAIAVATVLSLAQTTASAQPCDFAQADNAVRAMLARFPFLEGAALLVGNRDGILHEAYFGDYGPSTVVPLASASKLISGAAIMTLIDDGRLDPDAPVRVYLPEDFSFANAGLKSTMTVRQMFAHTAGLPGGDADEPILNNPTITLAEAIAQIACCVPLEAVPGASFEYGGLSMQVAGRVAEVISGQDWESFVDSALSQPLGLTTIDYQGLGPTLNPRIAGSAQSSLTDYGRILEMLLRGGVVAGPDGPVRVLSESSVRSMITDQTVGLPRRSPPPPGAEDFGYGFGVWAARTNAQGETIEYTSPGAFGTTPWVDLERGIYTVMLVDGVRQLLATDLDAIKNAVEQAVDQCPAPCPADLVGQPGILNFFDLAAYLARFNARDPRADLAPPAGIFNFFDLASYLDLYNTGCP
jgi:serine-type D-Ala-D-Ala carboxypeptidase/endopeptidase